ncbi:carboxylate-amine ligase [Streptomyces sp. NBC_01429]|uniref:carboxylate-amine ligase n=1 Tax=Streptomyces sp. NBC_01429 TaxID=2903862 RepID=UPI002E2C6DB3|nr:glutamate--cysteine ligase [Streptomyces sp. NBC_01429]
MTQPLTVGVEEEFFLVDPDSGSAVSASEEVIAAAASVGPAERLHPETSTAVVETVTEPHRELSLLADDVRALRAAAAAAAQTAGCAVLPCGTELVAGPYMPPTSGSRYRAVHKKYGAYVFGHMPCGLHVHVGMPDREHAVRVGNHLRPWLPTLQALAANSPFSLGEDTGYASFRSMWWSYLPVAGPAPLFTDAAQYNALLDRLVASGVILDRKMAYWFARPSEFVPTIEVRVMDVCPTSDTVTLLTGLTRALVTTCLRAVERDAQPAPVSDQLLAAAHWQAARYGLEGDALDLDSGLPLPVWTLVDRLLRHVAPALSEAGDLALVNDMLAETRRSGSWADRQRSIIREGGTLSDVSAHLRSLLLK